MRKLICNLAVLLSVILSGAALADAKTTATTVCASCHGANGISAADSFPNLAGQKKGYLVSALKAYKEKTRNNAMMNGLAAGLSDSDIDELATHFSGLKN